MGGCWVPGVARAQGFAELLRGVPTAAAALNPLLTAPPPRAGQVLFTWAFFDRQRPEAQAFFADIYGCAGCRGLSCSLQLVGAGSEMRWLVQGAGGRARGCSGQGRSRLECCTLPTAAAAPATRHPALACSEALAAEPAPGHHALAALHAAGRLRRHYTLNIDGLAEQVGMDTWHHERHTGGVTVEMHGNVRHLVCPECHATRPVTTALAKQVRCELVAADRQAGRQQACCALGPRSRAASGSSPITCSSQPSAPHLAQAHLPALRCPAPTAKQIRGKQAVPCEAPGCEGGLLRFKVMMYDDGEGELTLLAPPCRTCSPNLLVGVAGRGHASRLPC